MNPLSRDIQQAVRWLIRHPGFSLVAIGVLGLSVGFSTALFSVVNGVLLRQLPYPNPEQLVMIWERSPHPNGSTRNVVMPSNAYAWRQRARTLSGLAAVANDRVTITGGGMEAEELSAQDVTANTFAVLGVAPTLGRSFTAAEGEGQAAQVAIITDALWRRRFGADPGTLGRIIDVDGRALTVIGIMPPGFRLLNIHSDIRLPLVLSPDLHGRYLSVIGRLRPGTTIDQAKQEFAAIATQLETEQPEFDAGWATTLVSLREQLVGDIRTTLLVTFAAVLVLLAIAYFNVGNLLLNRAVARRKEIGLRLALGATRARLTQQFLAESACVAVGGCVVGLAVAGALQAGLLRLLSPGVALPPVAQVSIDARVIGFLVLASIVATLLLGVVPVWAFTGSDIHTAIGGTDRGGTAGVRHRQLRSVLVAGEVALALVLLVGAGLLVRTMQRLDEVDLGMRPEGVLAFRVSLPMSRYADEIRQREFYGALLARVQGIPGVRAAGAVRWLPLTGEKTASTFWPAEAPKPKPGEEPTGDIRIVGGQYFASLRIPLRRGRLFDTQDTENSPDVLVVNQALADRLWPGQDPIGKRIVVPWGRSVNGHDVPVQFEFSVIGVVGNDREESPAQAPAQAMYWWYGQHAETEMSFVLRTGDAPGAVAPAIRSAVHDLDAGLAVADLRTMKSVVGATLVRTQTTLTVLGVFAGMALMLAALGLYGVVAYWVSNRVREIGVRVALGAQQGDVLRLVVWQALAPTIAGVVTGLVLSMVVTRVMASLLYGVSPTDPVTLVTLATTLCLVAIAAGVIPGLRAMRVDPAVALQSE